MMLGLTEEQELVRKTAHDLAERELAPIAARIDMEHMFPTEVVAQMGRLGLMGIAVPEEFGGGGMDNVAYVAAMIEIARACASTAVIVSVQNSLVCDPILRYGTDAQKRDVLAPLARGEKLGCFALTEPDVGSDAAGLKTTAVRDGDGWVLDGTKQFITNGAEADWVLVITVTDAAAGTRGMTAFLVPIDGERVKRGRKEDKLGIRGASCCQLIFDACHVSADAMLGALGQGFKVAMTTLDGGRIGIAAQAIGIGRAALADALAYGKDRRTFGKPIVEHQAVQFMLADMAAELEAAELMTLRAARLKDAGQSYSQASAMAKLVAAEAAVRAALQGMQIHGGIGYMMECSAQRHVRDALITPIYEGTSEIQRMVIGRGLLA